MRINTNVASLNTQRILGQSNSAVAKSIGKLSSGFRINKAADDAAGLGIANQLRADIRSLKQASRNAEQANSMLQVAEGATQTISSIVDRMKELATQAGSDNVDADGRGRIVAEWNKLSDEITAITSTTKFQGKNLIDGGFGNAVDSSSAALGAGTGLHAAKLNGAAAGEYTFSQAADGELTLTHTETGVAETITGVGDGRGSYSFSKLGVSVELNADFDSSAAGGTLDGETLDVTAGADGGTFLVRSSGDYTGQDTISLGKIDLTLSGLGLDALSLDGNSDSGAWRSALTTLDSAVGKVNEAFGEIGAAQNRIEYASQNVKSTIENLTAAESTIRDADMAAEMAEFTRHQILQQAGTAMLAQANSAPQMVLRLLQ